MTGLLFNDSPLARDAVMLAERELAQTIRWVVKKEARMAAVETSDDEELRAFLRAFPSLRAYPDLRGDDVLSRCRGCRAWLLREGTRRGRDGVPECVAGKAGADSFCAKCVPAKAKPAVTRYAVPG